MGRRELISKVLGAGAMLGATAANADIDYAGVGFLGGSSTIDVNNANIRVYTKVTASAVAGCCRGAEWALGKRMVAGAAGAACRMGWEGATLHRFGCVRARSGLIN